LTLKPDCRRMAGVCRRNRGGTCDTFATIGLDQGVDVLYVAEMLGHSSPAITMGVYQHVRRDRLNAAMAQITEAIDG